MKKFNLKNRSIIAVLLLSMLVVLSAISAFGAELSESGICGTSVEYKLYDDGLLEITGSGAMSDFTVSDIPWKDKSASVTSLKLSPSITGIGVNAFINLNVKSVKVPESVVLIGAYSLGYLYDGTNYTKTDGFSITGKKGTAAERYALDNGFSFVEENQKLPNGECGSSLKWELSADGVLTVSGQGNMYDFDSPASTPWYKYFAGKDGFMITSLVLSDGVTSLGRNSFSGCRGITSVSLPSGLKKIGSSALEDCTELASVKIPSTVTVIGENSFAGCTKLSQLTVESGVTSVGDGAFSMTAIKSLVFPETVTEIGEKAFNSCESLETASLPGVVSISDKAFFGCYSLKTASFGNSLAEIKASAFEGCNTLASLNLPKSLQAIGERAFYSCLSLTSLKLPDSLKELGEFAFSDCRVLTTVNIGNGVSVIPVGAFESCEMLKSIVVGNSVETISERAFTVCPALERMEIPYTVRFIAENSIGYYYVEDDSGVGEYQKYVDHEITILSFHPSVAQKYAEKNEFNFSDVGIVPDDNGNLTEGVKWKFNPTTGVLMINGRGEVPDYITFSDTPWQIYSDYITTVIYGSGITNVGSSSFEGCSKLDNVTISNTVTEIGAYAFSGTDIDSITLSKGLKIIGDSAFEGCKRLTNVSLPDTLEHIGQYAFRGPNNLKTLFIPESVGFIGSYSVGYDVVNDVVFGFVIKGEKGSVAYNYAEENSISFREDGYVAVSDSQSGCSISILGSDDKKYVLSCQKTASTLEPYIFLSKSEYALVYEILLKLNDENASFEGPALVSFPTPENVNPIGIKIYYTTDRKSFTEIPFEVRDNKLVFSASSLGSFVITNADLHTLYNVTVNHLFNDSTAAHPAETFKATPGAEFTVTYIETNGFEPNSKTISGTVTDKDVSVSFVYKTSDNVSSDNDTTESEGSVSLPLQGGGIKTVFIVIEVILIVGIIAAVTALVILTYKKKKDDKKKLALAARGRVKSDKFADTIVIPDAPTREIDIQSLFSDEPEEDKEAAIKKNRIQRPKKK